jgi:hypothetical protein
MSEGAMYIVIGAPGEGKTPFCKKMIGGADTGTAPRRCLIFDINNEYGPRTKYRGQTPFNISHNTRDIRSRYIGDDITAFLNIARTKADTVIVMEEATAFFEGKTSQLTRRLIINRYHTRNVYLFLFHSINAVPPRIMEIANYVVLFKTNDERDTVYRKYSRLGAAFEELQSRRSGSGDMKILKLI